jgi:branched-chain amino acid transport system permease protein
VTAQAAGAPGSPGSPEAQGSRWTRGSILLAIALAIALVFPAFAGAYALSVGTLILYFAYTSQAWNVMMGFAGQLSLGHALYVGLGAYAAGALYFHFGIGPWAGLPLAIVVAAAAGVAIGVLAFRFGVSGVYFALLTIAFAEFTRIGFDHLQWTGGPGGMFLKVEQRDAVDLIHFRGPPALYYYAMLALAAGALALCARLLESRAGYYWRAIREDEDAAQALGIHVFRWKLLAVAISAGMTAVSGVFFAFYYNNLFPEQIFSTGRSIEIILGSVIGGVGTLFGPIFGAVVLTALSEAVTELLAVLGWEIPGSKQVVYGVVLLVVVMFLPQGIWPPLAQRLGLGPRAPGNPPGGARR